MTISSQSENKSKMVGRNFAVALGTICIILVALIAYFTITGISAQNNYNNLRNQDKQLQTWLDENGTLLNQTQANVTNLQNQVSSLNSQISQLASNVTNVQTWLYGNESLLSSTENWLKNNVTYYNSQITNLQNQIRALESSYPLNSMWVSPSTISYSARNASVGTLFNVTVWAYMQSDTFDWQVTLDFDPSVFQEVATGYTAGGTSAFFAGHTTVPGGPVINETGGTILFGESLLGSDYGARQNASLMFAEFNITTLPATKTPITGLFDLNATGTSGTFFDDTNGNTIVSAADLYDANFTLSYGAPPPTISDITQVPNVPNYNGDEPIMVSVNVTDNSGTGIANVTIVYSFDSWIMNSTAPMTLNTTTGFYEGTIPAYNTSTMTVLDYVIQAYDNSGGFTEIFHFPYVVLGFGGKSYPQTQTTATALPRSLTATLQRVHTLTQRARTEAKRTLFFLLLLQGQQVFGKS